jgi:type II secretory pathway pseudopilin PulG
MVVIIIGTLASIMIPKFRTAQRDARVSARAGLLNIYNRASQRFQTDTDLFPAKLDDLAATSAPANGLTGAGVLTPIKSAQWHGPYVSGTAAAPVTGNSFIYNTTGARVGMVDAPPESATSVPVTDGGTGGTGPSTLD